MTGEHLPGAFCRQLLRVLGLDTTEALPTFRAKRWKELSLRKVMCAEDLT